MEQRATLLDRLKLSFEGTNQEAVVRVVGLLSDRAVAYLLSITDENRTDQLQNTLWDLQRPLKPIFDHQEAHIEDAGVRARVAETRSRFAENIVRLAQLIEFQASQ